MSVSFAKVTLAQYNALAPVQDRIYYITDTGEQYLNGLLYKEDTNDYFCVEMVGNEQTALTFQFVCIWQQVTSHPELEYSFDKISWTACTWTNNYTMTPVSIASKGKVWIRGNNTTFPQAPNRYPFSFTSNGLHKVSGNIMSLLDKTCKKTTLSEDEFARLFKDDIKLVSAKDLKLPAMSVPPGAYSSMFENDQELQDVPELPATSVGAYAYYSIFKNCHLVNRIKVGFASWFENAAVDWVNGVAQYGEFICPSELAQTQTFGNNAIPSGWAVNTIEDTTDYLCIDAGNNASQAVVMVTSSGSVPNSISLEYSYDKKNWTAVTLNQWIWFSAQNPKVWLRGNNATINTQEGIANRNNAHYMIFSNYQNIHIPLKVTGNIMSLLDKTCQRDDVPDYCFAQLFNVGTNDPVFALTADSDISLPAKSVGRNGYERLFYKQPLMVKCPEIKATQFGAYACVSMCYSCASLEVAPSVLNIQDIQAHAFEYMFGSCTKLLAAPCISFAEKATVAQHWGDYMFKDDTNLSWIKVDNGIVYNGNNVSGYYVGSNYTYNWLENTVNGGSAIGWVFWYVGASISERSNFVASLSNNWDKDLAIAEAKSPTGDEQVVFKTICPNANETLVLTPSPNNLIRIAVMPIPKSQVAYASVVIDYASGNTVQYNTNLLTLVDPLVEGKRNHCVIRWSNGVAKLFVVDTEDIPQ